ncbi:hypothetical protein [Bacillus wiedmannii]|uniref:hypothetical protein n=1 Tax=Bacillus wiedmannii TaxID=1890302 RepID=UPI0021D00693|nr:hypothetical protein [Bacillus wiedmannii]MCU5578426.1 hypothetical protein [Bacillus wiedmannii]
MKKIVANGEIKQIVEERENNAETKFHFSSKLDEVIDGFIKENKFLMLFSPPLEDLKKIERLILEHESEMWCIDFQIVAHLMDEVISSEMVAKYVEDNLEYYIEELTSNSMYKLHIALIKEAYEAYNLGFYKLCVFPLISTFDHVFSLWCEGKIQKKSISIEEKPNTRRLHARVKPDEYEKVRQEYFTKIFTVSILRMYKKMFLKIPEQLPNELNRNAIMHGFYDYESITKEDVLKLFQLLKSAIVLTIADSSQLLNNG